MSLDQELFDSGWETDGALWRRGALGEWMPKPAAIWCMGELEEFKGRGREAAREVFARSLDQLSLEELDLSTAQEEDGDDGSYLEIRAAGIATAASHVRCLRFGAAERGMEPRTP